MKVKKSFYLLISLVLSFSIFVSQAGAIKEPTPTPLSELMMLPLWAYPAIFLFVAVVKFLQYRKN